MIDHTLERFSNPLKSVLTRALVFAAEKGATSITPAHLLWALATQPQSAGNSVLHKAHISLDHLTTTFPNIASQKPTSGTPNLSTESRRILEKAILAANLHDHPFIGTEHVLFGFLQAHIPEVHTLLFQTARLEKTPFEQALTQTLKEAQHFSIDEQKTVVEGKKDACEHCGEAHDDEPEGSALEYFGKELTKKDAEHPALPLIGRTQEIDRLATILARKTKHHPLLVGDPGVGKTAIVEGLAQRILSGNVPDALKNTRIFSLDMGSLVAGAMYRGDFEARILDILEELKHTKGAVVFIDELHTLMGAGSGGGSLDAANMLKPALARGEIHLIGATTQEEYKKFIEPDGALARRLQKITVKEPNAEETLAILQGIAPTFAQHHHTSFSLPILQEIVTRTERLMPMQRFPDKAIDILDELGARTSGRKATINDVLMSISAQTGTPFSSLHTSEMAHLAALEQHLAHDIVGQKNAVHAVATALVRAKLGFAPPERPLASFLFAGPSGVGKTALTKALAKHLIGAKKGGYLRLDMSEYAEPHSMSKLIGSPAGYIGYKDRAHLTDSVKENPSLIVVFDECEKAHRNVHHLLLQILEEGEIRDGGGTLVNFRNTIIVVTTNAAKELFEKHALGFTQEQKNTNTWHECLEEKFSKELLQRFDALCLFTPLQQSDIEHIVRNELSALQQRLKQQGVTLAVPAKSISLIAKRIETKKGGRGVRHMLRTLIEEPLAEKIVQSSYKKRSFALKHTKEHTLTLQ